MNLFLLPTTQTVPTLLIAFKDTFKAELLELIADQIPFKYQIITDRTVDIFEFLEKNPTDYLLLDDNFLKTGAIGFLRMLKLKKISTKVIIYAEKVNIEYLNMLLASPVVGFIKKECTLEEFSKTLRKILQGERIFFYDMNDLQKSNNQNSKQSVQIDPSDFTERQNEVWRLLKDAKSGKQIAQQLNISIDTVKTHKNDISKKLNLPPGTRLSILAIASKNNKNS